MVDNDNMLGGIHIIEANKAKVKAVDISVLFLGLQAIREERSRGFLV